MGESNKILVLSDSSTKNVKFYIYYKRKFFDCVLPTVGTVNKIVDLDVISELKAVALQVLLILTSSASF